MKHYDTVLLDRINRTYRRDKRNRQSNQHDYLGILNHCQPFRVVLNAIPFLKKETENIEKEAESQEKMGLQPLF